MILKLCVAHLSLGITYQVFAACLEVLGVKPTAAEISKSIAFRGGQPSQDSFSTSPPPAKTSTAVGRFQAGKCQSSELL